MGLVGMDTPVSWTQGAGYGYRRLREYSQVPVWRAAPLWRRQLKDDLSHKENQLNAQLQENDVPEGVADLETDSGQALQPSNPDAGEEEMEEMALETEVTPCEDETQCADGETCMEGYCGTMTRRRL